MYDKKVGEKSNTFTELDFFGNMIMIFFTSLALYSMKTKTSSLTSIDLDVIWSSSKV